MPRRPPAFQPVQSQSPLGPSPWVVRGIGLAPEQNGRRERYEVAGLDDDGNVFACRVGHNEGTVIVGRPPRESGRGDSWRWITGRHLEITWH